MNNTYTKVLSFIFLSLFCTCSFNRLQAQSYTSRNFGVDYFGIQSENLDSNMKKMTSDLYFTQLGEFSNLTINDCRNSESSLDQISYDNHGDFSLHEHNLFSNERLSFFARIKKDEDSSKWITSLFLINGDKKASISKEYDSFYKILMEPKSVLQENIKELLKNAFSAPDYNAQNNKNKDEEISTEKKTIVSTEELSGTWTGEDFIDKIIIMRGGRGFVIFKNGASMNVKIELSTVNGAASQKNIIITQNGKSNASFFPNLTRTVALSAAVNAQPIEWNLTLTDENTLSGSKKTLIATSDGSSAEPGTEQVIWKRKL